MRFPTPLVPARLVRRYKRFFADVTLEADGREVTAHTPNPGAMMGLTDPGSRIWVEPNDDPRKKLKYGWRLTETESGGFIGVDTGVPNRVVGESLRAGMVPELAAYSTVRPEVPYGTHSRVDFLLTEEGLPDAYVEVKNVHTMRTPGLAEFPDCVTERGAKHLRELAEVSRAGHRAVLFYLIQRDDCSALGIAGDLDPGYDQAVQEALVAGVEMICYDTNISREEITLGKELDFRAS